MQNRNPYLFYNLPKKKKNLSTLTNANTKLAKVIVPNPPLTINFKGVDIASMPST